MKLVPTTQITFDSDYSYFSLSQIETLRKMELTAGDLRAIEHGNATRLIPRLSTYGAPVPCPYSNSKCREKRQDFLDTRSFE
jgi:hypothetical protein